MTEQVPETLSKEVRRTVSVALAEDVGSGDLTAALVPAQAATSACVIVRQNAVICGRPWFDEVFRQLSSAITISWHAEEGQQVKANDVICELTGPARSILTGERSALNFLQTLSATATATNSCVEAIKHSSARILDTRKTLPGLRLAQKYAVRTGGGINHRIGLFDAFLIKENHILAGGGIVETVTAAENLGKNCLIEVEVESLQQTEEALGTIAGRLLLDNFSLSELRQAVDMRNVMARNITLEASGGIDQDSVIAIAETGVDFISLGSLTKNIDAVDLSMRFHDNHQT